VQEKFAQAVGWLASIAGVLMFLAYIDQIRLNPRSHEGSVVQPAATVLNCAIWATYGAVKQREYWPIIVANIPGIILGTAALLTMIIYPVSN
jgi:uncharacterized protein with PQ loop repeat